MPQTQRSKEDADRLVESLKRKGNSGRELQLKGFHIASLYSQAKEYALALPYCQNYISLKPNDARAHKLLGQIYEARNNIPRAIDGYRRALELNDTQKDLILKVADLYCQVRCEPERHRYWAEKAEKYFPGHEIVHKTREHIFRADGKLSELEQYLRAKLRTYPSDPKLHVQLLLVLVELGRLNEAKQLCVKVESSHLFDNDQRWWEQAINVYLTMLRSWGREQSHHGQVACITTYCSLLYAINRLVLLSLANPTMPTAQTAEMLKRLDHDLVKASDSVASSQYSVEVPYGQITLDEMKAQMYYHVGTLLMKMAANNQVRWNDVMGMATVSYLVSLQVVPDPGHANSKNEGLANLYKMGCSRLSEICHVLHGLVKQHSADWLEECVEQWCNEEGRQQFLYQVFGDDSGVTELSSLHVDDSFLLTNTPELPDLVDSVFQFDQVSIMYEPSNLHRLVWLGLQWDIRQDGILPDIGSFIEGVFDRLVFSTKNLDNISVDNIRHLDIEAFLYASVHIAGVQLARLNERDLISKDLPKQRPLVLHRGLCSEEQLEWYTALYQLYSAKAKSSERGKLRMMAQKGLEILRCRINHGLETGVLVQLGKTFHARMTEVQSQSEDPRDKQDQWQAYQRMSVLYWQSALEHLKLLASGKAVPQHKKPFFPYMKQTLEGAQIQQYLDEGSVVVSEFKFQQGKHTEALTYLDKAKTPNALYTKAVMYKTLAGLQTDGRSEDELNTSQVSKHGELLDKAKYALFATMDSIEDKPNHSLHTPVQEMLVEVESDQTCMAGQLSMMDSTAYDTSRISGIAADVSNRSFGVKSEYDAEEVQVLKEPSPRRLAAELRAMNSSHTRVLEENASLRELQSSHGKILEQNQSLMEKQNDLMESNNTLMKQIVEMNMKFQELSTQMAQKQMETPPATPAPPPPASTQAATITSNTPLIISTQLCRIETKNVAGGLHPSLVASPATLHGMYQPAYAAPPPGAYYDQNHGYGYGYPDPTHMMAASTPTGHHGLVQSPYQGFEENEMVPGLSLGHNINQGIPQSSMAQHPGFAASPIGLLGNQAQQMPGQHPQTNTMLINDPNTAARMPVPDVASRASAGGAAYFSSDQSQAAMSPARPVSAAERGITDVSPPPLGAPTGNKTESPLLMSMLTEGRKGKGQPGVSGGIVAGSSPQSGSPVRPQAATFSFVPSDTASISQPASQPQSFVFGKPQTPSGSFSLGSQQTKPTEGQQSSAISEFSFRAQSTPTSATTVTTASPQSKSTPVTTAAQSPFAGFSFSGSSAQKAATPTVFGQPASTVASSTSMFSQQPVFSPSPATASKPSTSVFGQPDSSASSSKTSIFGQQPVLGQSSFVFGQPASSASSSTTSTFGQPASASSSSSSIFGQQSGFGQSPSFGASLKASAFDQQPISGQSSATDVSSTTSLGQKSASVFGQPSKPVTPSFTKPTPAKQSEDEDVLIVSNKMPTTVTKASLHPKSTPVTTAAQSPFAGFSFSGSSAQKAATPTVFGQPASTVASSTSMFSQQPVFSQSPATASNPSTSVFGQPDSSASSSKTSMFGQQPVLGQSSFVFGQPASSASSSTTSTFGQPASTSSSSSSIFGQQSGFGQSPSFGAGLKASGFGQQPISGQSSATDVSSTTSLGQKSASVFGQPSKPVTPSFTKPTPAKQSEDIFEAAVEDLKINGTDSSKSDITTTPEMSDAQSSEPFEDFMAKFAIKPGQWECDACYTRNPPECSACLACQTPKPVDVQSSEISSSSSEPEEADKNDDVMIVSVKMPSAALQEKAKSLQLPLTFYNYEDVPPCPGCVGCDPDDLDMNTCRLMQEKHQAEADSANKLASNQFGTSVAASQEVSSQGPSSGMFGSGFKGMSIDALVPDTGCGFNKKGQHHGNRNLYNSSGKSNPIAMQDPSYTIDLKTGHEEEECLYKQRCRLYRFDAEKNQWKERGVGDVKLMKHSGTGRVRVVMRRDQVHKVYANEIISTVMHLADIETSDHAWVYSAIDLLEGQTSLELVAVMFKTQQIAHEFKVKFAEWHHEICQLPVIHQEMIPTNQLFSQEGGDETDTDRHDEQNQQYDPQYEAIVTLPDAVDLKTGHEEEECLYKQRCRLYRFDAEKNQWKERGVGDVKLMKHKGSGRVRVVMRHEQVHKVCANHTITTSMQLKVMEMSDRAWVYNAIDFSEGEASPELLAIKFKTPDIAHDYKTKFEKCQTEMAQLPVLPQPASTSSSSSSTDEDVMIVSVKMPSAALQEKAKSLQLPLTFYNYEDAPPCPGCVGCDPDDLDKNRLAREQRQADSANKSASNQFGASSAAFQEVSSQGPSGGMFGSGSKGMSFAALATDTGSVFLKKDTVDLKTGHEEEECLYKQRCRLYRFDAEKNQWKERGVGDVKLMKHSGTGRVQVVIRRDQVHKVCANEIISTVMHLADIETSDHAWVYSAIDFSEGQTSLELVAVMFKTQEIAHEFKVKFAEWHREICQLPVVQQESSENHVVKFTPKPGEWECGACHTCNPADKIRCLACQTPKPGTGVPSAAPAMTEEFTFGPQSTGPPAMTGGFTFGPQQTGPPEWECDACNTCNPTDAITCMDCWTPKPGAAASDGSSITGGFKFGTPLTRLAESKLTEDQKTKTAKLVGKWECDACYTRNPVKKMSCLSCHTPKPGTAPAPVAFVGIDGLDLETQQSEPSESKASVNLKECAPEPIKWPCNTCGKCNPSDRTACSSCLASKPNASAVAEFFKTLLKTKDSKRQEKIDETSSSSATSDILGSTASHNMSETSIMKLTMSPTSTIAPKESKPCKDKLHSFSFAGQSKTQRYSESGMKTDTDKLSSSFGKQSNDGVLADFFSSLLRKKEDTNLLPPNTLVKESHDYLVSDSD